MNRKYIAAGVMALIGIALAATSIVLPESVGFGGLVLASTAVPAAVLLVVVGRLDRKVPVAALIAGGTLAVAMSLIGYALLGGAVYFFAGGFGEWLVSNGEGVLDTDLMETLRNPWMIIFAIEVIVLAPLVEEFSKAISARLSKPFDRKSALLAGVATGVGFAVIENIAYATGGFFVEGGWETVVLVRMLGSAVHPVAAGLVSLGWWEFRTQADRGSAVRLIGAGVGVHALWNGAVTAVLVASSAFTGDATPLESVLVTIAYAGALGVIIAAAGWQALGRVANGDLPGATADPGDAKTMSAWVVIASTVLVPAIAVVFALNSGF
jgi:RsiW-degrading membrane proteinase PrsW (M82 family)